MGGAWRVGDLPRSPHPRPTPGLLPHRPPTLFPPTPRARISRSWHLHQILTPWYLAPTTPSPVIPHPESFEFELSFYSAVGGNESLIADEDLAALFPSRCVTKSFPVPEDPEIPRFTYIEDVATVKAGLVSPHLSLDDPNALQRLATGDCDMPMDPSRSPSGDTLERSSNQDNSTVPGCDSAEGGYDADSESRLAGVTPEKPTTPSNKSKTSSNLKRKREAQDEDVDGNRVLRSGERFGGERPLSKKCKTTRQQADAQDRSKASKGKRELRRHVRSLLSVFGPA